MKVTPTETFPEVLVMEPRVFADNRGFFFESFNARTFQELTGLTTTFVQDNHSRSVRGVLRGMHYQIQHAQGKLVRVIHGEVFDAVVDLRRSSPTFGKWTAVVLSAENMKQIWIPPGFAHGFLTLSETAEFLYKTTDYWHAAHERTLLWNDPEVGIEWPLSVSPILADKDARGHLLRDAETYA
ncbi:dTDP-4-dehydrorhamnose 3,5-epimerase [compost metagenome]